VPEFAVNVHRFDPYKDFKFRVKWDGRYVAGVSYVSPLRRRTDVVEHRTGGDPSSPRRSPGVTRFAPIVLRRGVTHDNEFERWANKVWKLGTGLGVEVSLSDFRKNLVLDFLNEAGQLALSYHVYRCWVSEYVALPELNANGGGVAIQSITLENEGWERDLSVAEPVEPSFDDPVVGSKQAGPVGKRRRA
jgi:phage tail-like protein